MGPRYDRNRVSLVLVATLLWNRSTLFRSAPHSWYRFPLKADWWDAILWGWKI